MKQDNEQERADGIDSINEDLPTTAPPTEGLPTLPEIPLEEHERKRVKDEGKGLEKAMEIMEEYEKGVPPRNPYVQNYEE